MGRKTAVRKTVARKKAGKPVKLINSREEEFLAGCRIGIVASIVKALSPHFGAYAIYNLDDKDILIVATRATALPAPTERVFQWPRLRAELDRIGVQSLSDLQSRLVGDDRTIGPLLNSLPVAPNSDYFPFVDLNAPRLRFMLAGDGVDDTRAVPRTGAACSGSRSPR